MLVNTLVIQNFLKVIIRSYLLLKMVCFYTQIDAAMTVDAFDSEKLDIAHAEPLFECTTGGK